MSSKKIFLVTAYRGADRNNHSYTVGIYDTFEEAYQAAESEENYRAGKYSCAIRKTTMGDSSDNDTIYRTPLDERLLDETSAELKKTLAILGTYDHQIEYLQNLYNVISDVKLYREDATPKGKKLDHEFRSETIAFIKSYIDLRIQKLRYEKSAIYNKLRTGK